MMLRQGSGRRSSLGALFTPTYAYREVGHTPPPDGVEGNGTNVARLVTEIGATRLGEGTTVCSSKLPTR
jgi:hypothetical protein